jgi:hypothetical protein
VETANHLHPLAGIVAAALVGVRHTAMGQRWADFLNTEVTAAGIVVEPSERERVEPVLNRIRVAAMQTRRREKWELLAQALISTALHPEWEDFVVEYFADLVARLTPEHVKVLQVMNRPGDYGIDAEDPQTEQLIEALQPNATEEERADQRLVLDATWSDLVGLGLLGEGFGRATGQMTDNGDGTLTSRSPTISSTGRRFLAYLSRG